MLDPIAALQSPYGILGLLLLATCFNVARYGNSKLLVVAAAVVAALYLYNSSVTGASAPADHYIERSRRRDTIHRAHLQRIVESFEPTELVTSSYDIHRLPKRFRYVFVKADVWKQLISIATARRLDKATVYKVFATVERFLKVFYNAITSAANRKNALETLGQLMDVMRELRTDMLMSLSHAPDTTKWANTQFRAIETVMADKVAVLRALVDGKIK